MSNLQRVLVALAEIPAVVVKVYRRQFKNYTSDEAKGYVDLKEVLDRRYKQQVSKNLTAGVATLTNVIRALPYYAREVLRGK